MAKKPTHQSCSKRCFKECVLYRAYKSQLVVETNLATASGNYHTKVGRQVEYRCRPLGEKRMRCDFLSHGPQPRLPVQWFEVLESLYWVSELGPYHPANVRDVNN